MATRRRHGSSRSKTPRRPQIGFKVDPVTGEPTRTQARFNFGQNPSDVEYRSALVRRLYEENCVANGAECWSPLALSYARMIEKGVSEIPFEMPEQLLEDDSLSDEERAAEYVFMLRHQQKIFPSLKLVPADDGLFRRGVTANRKIEASALRSLYDDLVEEGTVAGNTQPPDKLVLGTLHEALDGYAVHIQKTGPKIDDGTLKPSQQKRLEHVKTLKEHHDDMQLHELSFDRIAELLGHWTNRPKTKKGTRYKPTAARHPMKELERFLRWLDATSEFNWEQPRGVEQISRKFTELPEDYEANNLLKKPIYSVEQLGLINRYATQMDRLLLYTGVNCAFGAAEIGRLTKEEVLIHQTHEFAERLHFETTSSDSFIRFNRPKSKMFGEWLLWPETVDVLQWGIARSEGLKSQFIVCTEDGKQLYKEKKVNGQVPFANRWDKLIDRVQKHHTDFPHLPFGTLRDTLPDVLRHRFHDELASICLAHRTAYKPDKLLEAYGNKPYGRLHSAIRELHDHFEPMFHGATRE